MAGISFLATNLIDEATITVSSGGENAQFPLSNLKNSSPAIKFQSLTDTSVILIDMLSNQTVDTVALKGDSTGELGIITANLRYSNTTDFTGSPVLPITLSSEFNAGIEFITEVDARYWELTLTAGTFCELGVLYMGKKLNLPQQSYSINSFRYGYQDKSTTRTNEYGQAFINSRNLQKSLSGQIQFATQSETETLDDMFRELGTSRPFWTVVDESSTALSDGKFRFLMYGYLTAVPEWNATGGRTFNASLKTREAI